MSESFSSESIAKGNGSGTTKGLFRILLAAAVAVAAYSEVSAENNKHIRPRVIIYAEGNPKIKEASSLLYFKPEEEPQAHICPIVN